MYIALYIPVRLCYDNGRKGAFLVSNNFPGISFWYGGKYETQLFYLFYPLIVIDGKITGLNYLYSGEKFQIIQWNTDHY